MTASSVVAGGGEKATYSSALNEGSMNEARGNMQAALDNYKKALNFLKTDNISNTKQQGQINFVTEKIKRVQRKL